MAHLPEHRPICGRPRSRGRGPCQSKVLYSNGCCIKHGGKNAAMVGVANPNYKHGKYSRFLPEQLRHRYEALREDQADVSLADSLALAELRITTLLEQIATGESAGGWKKLDEAYAAAERARRSSAPDAAAQFVKAWADIGRLRDAGMQQTAVYSELQSWLEQYRRLYDTHLRDREGRQQNVPLEQVMVFIGAVLASLRQHITDPAILLAIQTDIDQLMNARRRHSTGTTAAGPTTSVTVDVEATRVE